MVTRLRVTKGLVYRISIYIPSGALGYHHIAIHDGGPQIWPSSPGTYFRGDGDRIDFEDTYLKYAEPWEFQIKTWNEDDSYAHTAVISIGMVSEAVFMARYLPSLSYDKMLEVLKTVAATQEAEKAELIAQPFSWLPKALTGE